MDRALLRLMAVTDEPGDSTAEFLQVAAAAVRGGATCVQLRAKGTESGRLLELARMLVGTLPVPVIVNDRADIAIAAGAAGVHLGADDLAVPTVRSFAPPGFLVGASVGNDDELAGSRGADYVGVGPVFGTVSKSGAGAAIGTEEMARLIRASGSPGVGIGGIDAGNARAVIEAGADGIAALSAIFLADDPESAARALRSAIER